MTANAAGPDEDHAALEQLAQQLEQVNAKLDYATSHFTAARGSSASRCISQRDQLVINELCMQAILELDGFTGLTGHAKTIKRAMIARAQDIQDQAAAAVAK